MEDLFPTFSTNIINASNGENSNVGETQNSHFSSHYEPQSYPATSSNSISQSSYNPIHYHPHGYPPEQARQHPPLVHPSYPCWFGQTGNEMPGSPSLQLQRNELIIKQETRVFYAHSTKVARSERKLLRQRYLNKISSSENNSCHVDTRTRSLNGAIINNTATASADFHTINNKRLRLLLRKELKTSDVGSLGRIILPKREAEENLPTLLNKEGIQVVVRDADSNQKWRLKFKYWSNNNSRMYVLEQTGEFVKQNGMEIGDILNLFEDDSKNLYFSITKTKRPGGETSYQQESTKDDSYNYLYTPDTCLARDEEELALLIEQLYN